jgi:hypothetical protein
MAELAGSAADGFNTQAGHPRLGELIDVARSAHQGRSNDFEISAFARLEPRWIDQADDRLDRLIMIASPREGIEPISRFAADVGLNPPGRDQHRALRPGRSGAT